MLICGSVTRVRVANTFRSDWSHPYFSRDLRRETPFTTYYVVKGSEDDQEILIGRILEAFQRILIIWRAKDTPNLPGVTCESDIIAAPYRNSRIDPLYIRSRTGKPTGSQWGAPSWSVTGYADREPTQEYLLVMPDGDVVDPCSMCKYSSHRLGGNCAPLGPTCQARQDKWKETK